MPSNVQPHRPMKVLSVGLPRTGSYSMCLALEQLGYQDVYHCMKTLNQPQDWRKFGEASDALFPNLPTYNGKGMTAADWDGLFGPCEALTDIAAPFVESLLDCYPGAKVVMVLRDFDRWEPSFRQLVGGNFGLITNLIRNHVEPLAGTTYTSSIQKFFLGWSHCKDKDQMFREARSIYDRHHELVREKVPKERLLEMRLVEGWEPLCQFLGRDVPKGPFPRANDAEALRKVMMDKRLHTLKTSFLFIWPYLLVVVLAVFLFRPYK